MSDVTTPPTPDAVDDREQFDLVVSLPNAQYGRRDGRWFMPRTAKGWRPMMGPKFTALLDHTVALTQRAEAAEAERDERAEVARKYKFMLLGAESERDALRKERERNFELWDVVNNLSLCHQCQPELENALADAVDALDAEDNGDAALAVQPTTGAANA